MRAKASEYINYVKSKVGNAYLWGGQGESVYELLRALAKKKGQSDSNTERMLAYVSAHGVNNLEFYDCSGLLVSFLLKAGAIERDMTADELYHSCGKISRQEARPGDMVFLFHSSGVATHVGCITDHASVVHALNQTRGVIEEALEKRKWVYARPDFVEYDLSDEKNQYKPGDRIFVPEQVQGYQTAMEAMERIHPAATYPKGEYFVYKIYQDAVNITRTKGVPGVWITM